MEKVEVVEALLKMYVELDSSVPFAVKWELQQKIVKLIKEI